VNALTELATRSDDAPVPILEIASVRQIPLHVLEHLFASLRRGGILKSQRGVKGGYSFNRPAREISVLDVVECVDGALRPVDVVSGADAIWNEARQQLADHLAAVTVAEIADHEARSAGTLMFHI
jgi:Rrf2 family cysteine metabolism transcriptional repressor